MLSDLRYAFRMLLNNPGFTIVAVVTLALGIGATTAIFSVFDAVVLKSLPVRNPDELFSPGRPLWCVSSFSSGDRSVLGGACERLGRGAGYDY